MPNKTEKLECESSVQWVKR